MFKVLLLYLYCVVVINNYTILIKRLVLHKQLFKYIYKYGELTINY